MPAEADGQHMLCLRSAATWPVSARSRRDPESRCALTSTRPSAGTSHLNGPGRRRNALSARDPGPCLLASSCRQDVLLRKEGLQEGGTAPRVGQPRHVAIRKYLDLRVRDDLARPPPNVRRAEWVALAPEKENGLTNAAQLILAEARTRPMRVENARAKCGNSWFSPYTVTSSSGSRAAASAPAFIRSVERPIWAGERRDRRAIRAGPISDWPPSRTISGALVSSSRAGQPRSPRRETRWGRSTANQRLQRPPMEWATTGIRFSPKAVTTESRKETAWERTSTPR